VVPVSDKLTERSQVPYTRNSRGAKARWNMSGRPQIC